MATMDFTAFNNARTGYNKQRASGLAQNAYKRFLARQRGDRNAFNINKKFEIETPNLVNQFSRRGLAGPNVQSGLYARGLTDLANTKTAEMFANQEDYDQTLQQLGFSDAEINALYNQRMAELQAAKNARIAETAGILNANKSWFN